MDKEDNVLERSEGAAIAISLERSGCWREASEVMSVGCELLRKGDYAGARCAFEPVFTALSLRGASSLALYDMTGPFALSVYMTATREQRADDVGSALRAVLGATEGRAAGPVAETPIAALDETCVRIGIGKLPERSEFVRSWIEFLQRPVTSSTRTTELVEPGAGSIHWSIQQPRYLDEALGYTDVGRAPGGPTSAWVRDDAKKSMRRDVNAYAILQSVLQKPLSREIAERATRALATPDDVPRWLRVLLQLLSGELDGATANLGEAEVIETLAVGLVAIAFGPAFDGTIPALKAKRSQADELVRNTYFRIPPGRAQGWTGPDAVETLITAKAFEVIDHARVDTIVASMKQAMTKHAVSLALSGSLAFSTTGDSRVHYYDPRVFLNFLDVFIAIDRENKRAYSEANEHAWVADVAACLDADNRTRPLARLLRNRFNA